MNLDDLLREARRVAGSENDALAARRAYRQVETGYRCGVRSLETVLRWNEELAWFTAEEQAPRLRREGVGDVSWWRESAVGSVTTLDARERAARRAFLAHAAAIAVGTHTIRSENVSPFSMDRVTDLVSVDISHGQIDRIEAAVTNLERMLWRDGASRCVGLSVSVLAEATPLWSMRAPNQRIRTRLVLALAKLYNFVGRLAADQGALELARHHFGRALDLGRESGSELLLAHVLCRVGQAYLDVDGPADALKMFQLAQICAQMHDNELLVAMICALQAWTYALLGHEDQVTKLLGRTRDELARVAPEELDRLRLPHDWIMAGPHSLSALVDIVVGLSDPRLRAFEPLASVDSTTRAG